MTEIGRYDGLEPLLIGELIASISVVKSPMGYQAGIVHPPNGAGVNGEVADTLADAVWNLSRELEAWGQRLAVEQLTEVTDG